jgi:anhydro-N-acetylmuramic acid kinase
VTERYIGLMSGTSMDGVDAVLVSLGRKDQPMQVHGHVHRPFSRALRQALLALNNTDTDELHQAALAANALSRTYGQAIDELLHQSSTAAATVRAVGAHGQTVRHRPGQFDGTGYTLQLLNGALLAELCGIDVICDFRSRDVAAGGQGAPLVPAFHAAIFQSPGIAQAVLNLGGIGNITLLGTNGSISGFDCGPGNVLMDIWCERHLGLAYDDGGQWASQGRIDQTLLNRLLAEPYMNQPPPKSTGRDLFNASWLDHILSALGLEGGNPVNIQATLAELTAQSATNALMKYLPEVTQMLVCGGGARNRHLMQRLSELLSGIEVVSTDKAGLPPMQVEAAAFAWLARAFVDRQPSNCPTVTGAVGARVLGALYPAG